MTQSAQLHVVLDRTGVIASIGCAIHCLIAPILVIMTPALGGWWVHPWTHVLIALLVLPIAGMALMRGYRQHHQRWIVGLGGLGMMLVSVGVVLPWFFTAGPALANDGAVACTVCRDCCPTVTVDAVTGGWSLRVPPASIVTVLGGLALIVAHLGNLRCACTSCRTGCALSV